MTNVSTNLFRQELSDRFDDALLFMTEVEFDDAVIGVSNTNVVVYDADQVIAILMTTLKCDDQDARDYFDYNVAGAYVGEKTPIFVWSRHDA